MLVMSMCHCSHVQSRAGAQGSGDLIHPLLQSSALFEVVLVGWRKGGKLLSFPDGRQLGMWDSGRNCFSL